MDYSCADREPVQLDRWDDTSNKISAKDQTIRKAVQREKSDSDTEDAVRFRPDERPLKQRPGDACPNHEPDKRDRNRDWRVAEERLVHEDRGHRVPQGQERDDAGEEPPYRLPVCENEPRERVEKDRREGKNSQSNREDGQIRHRAPSSRPLRRAHGADVIDRRKHEDEPERAEHEPGDQRQRGPREFGWRSADNRYAPRHAERMDTTPIRPIPSLICEEWPHNNLANGGVENGRNRFGRRHCLVIVVVDEPAMVREVMSNERECHLRSP